MITLEAVDLFTVYSLRFTDDYSGGSKNLKSQNSNLKQYDKYI